MTIDESRLQAYVDGALDAAERASVEAALRGDAGLARRVERLLEQRRRLRERFDPVLAEPIPERLRLARPAWIGHARAAALVAAGIAIGAAGNAGWNATAPAPTVAAVPSSASLPVRAARAHAVYAVEVRHPVEVDASQQEHLVNWLSKRLGASLKVPDLAGEGYDLLGGRLLPGPEGPVAQFMYQERSGRRLTLYVSAKGDGEAEAAFRFVQDGPVSVFYWIDRRWGYALSAEMDQPSLSRIATSVYRQLDR